uniref:Uncharacterized protein n=1 Tax=uncultured prokaryote TaxID=198431 RepID=A0A0H5Q8E5_9ZZZZ|nr:hypothetical protein [uncultured prokaryote]
MSYHVEDEPAGQDTLWVSEPDRFPEKSPGTMAKGPLTRRWSQRHEVDPRQHLDLRVTYRGTSEALYMVTARGTRGLFTGHVAIHDIAREVTMGERYYWESTAAERRFARRGVELGGTADGA